MSKKLILHIPHSSTNFPHLEGFIIEKENLKKEVLKLTDWYTEDLFESKMDDMIVATFARIFCDAERFTDDTQETMAKYGMGVLYEKNDDGDIIRVVTPTLKENILKNYYSIHHQNLNQAVDDQLKLFGKALIVDCHSYPNKPLTRDLDQNPKRPDFNIGTDSFHTSQKLIDLSVDFFDKSGYSLGVDWPYKGSIVPMAHYQKNKKVQTIMLEINRKLYLKEPTNKKSENYQVIKNVTKSYLNLLRENL